MAEDALAVMGILGLNPADQREDEADQVSEPEIDRLSEIISEEVEKIFEGFKTRRAPKSKKSSGAFQKRMKSRLAKAHRTYLDMGRKDLTKHGGGFRLDRPKNISNAFLAEEDIEEASGAAAIAGAPGAFMQQDTSYKRKDKNMKQDKRLRMRIREGLKSFFHKKSLEHSEVVAKILEEHALRMHLRNLIFEESLNEAEDPNTDVHDNTGINTLKDLLKNTNVLSTLREVYKTLTTSEDQRKSFRAHVIQWVQDTLAPVKLNDTDALPDENSEAIAEQQDNVGIDIEGVNDEDKEKFIDALDGSEKEKKPEKQEEEGLTTISGEDTTGRNKAERIYPNIEKSIIDYYAELDNPEDQEMFYDYLIANLKLYFDKWDGEMAKSIEEPTNDEYDQAAGNSEETPDTTGEEQLSL